MSINKLIKDLDKRYGPTKVFWSLVLIFVLLLLISSALIPGSFGQSGHFAKYGFFESRMHPSSGIATDKGMPTFGGPSGGGGYMMEGKGGFGGGMESMAPAMDGVYMRENLSIAPYPPYPPYPSASSVLLPSGEKVIYSASLALFVERAEGAAEEIKVIAEINGGFVENATVFEAREGVKEGFVVVRVPADVYEMVRNEIKLLALEVKNETETRVDVSAFHVDLEAEIANAKREEREYQRIMERAEKIEDVLNITNILAGVRNRIDNLQNSLNNLGRQVDMSTITISLISQPNVTPGAFIWRPWTVAKEAVANLLKDLAAFINFLIVFILKLPILILNLTFIAALVWFVWKFAVWLRDVMLR